ALPRLVPRSRAAAEHVPAHDGRASAAEDVLGERRARVDLAALLAVALAERLELDQPVVELLTADPERMLWRLVRAGDEAVDRHRDVQLQLAHRSPSVDMLIGPPRVSEVIGQASRNRPHRSAATLIDSSTSHFVFRRSSFGSVKHAS